MKVLLVNSGDDYAANSFENAHAGTKVLDIIANPDLFLPGEEQDEYEYWEFEVKEIGEVSPEFIEFIRNDIQDHDGKKHTNFYLENETVE